MLATEFTNATGQTTYANMIKYVPNMPAVSPKVETNQILFGIFGSGRFLNQPYANHHAIAKTAWKAYWKKKSDSTDTVRWAYLKSTYDTLKNRLDTRIIQSIRPIRRFFPFPSDSIERTRLPTTITARQPIW